jgi:hypothetical protein
MVGQGREDRDLGEVVLHAAARVRQPRLYQSDILRKP